MAAQMCAASSSTTHARARSVAANPLHVSLSEAAQVPLGTSVDLVALDDALESLEGLNVRQSRVIELHLFGGLDLEETAHVLGVSVPTVRRDWSLARAWPFRGRRQNSRNPAVRIHRKPFAEAPARFSSLDDPRLPTPIFELKAGDPYHVIEIGGHERSIERECMCGDGGIEILDARSTPFQGRLDPPVCLAHGVGPFRAWELRANEIKPSLQRSATL
jgi:hypothetical protein